MTYGVVVSDFAYFMIPWWPEQARHECEHTVLRHWYESLDGQLTHTELHDLANGEFDFTVGDDGHPRARSIFRIRRASIGTAQDRILLEPK